MKRTRFFPMVATLITLVFLTWGCGRNDASPSPEEDRETEQHEILEALEDLFEASDAATSPVTVQLPTGEWKKGRRPLPSVVRNDRAQDVFVPPDPLGAVSRTVAGQPVDARGFDWAPGSSRELLVANDAGLWRCNVESETVALWIPLSRLGFVPREVRSNPDGRVLLAQPGRAVVARESADTASVDLTEAPDSFRFDYAFWRPGGDSVVGVLERLAFFSPDERILLEASEWNPSAGTVERYGGPDLSDSAWLGSSLLPGAWVSLEKRVRQVDPFPRSLRMHKIGDGKWTEILERGEWTDADLVIATVRDPDSSSSETTKAAALWIRRTRAGIRNGPLWYRNLDGWTADSPVESLGRESGDGAKMAVSLPLTHRRVEHVAVAYDGSRIAWSDDVSRGRAPRLHVADLQDAARAAEAADTRGAERRRDRVAAEFLERVRNAYADQFRPEVKSSPLPAEAEAEGAVTTVGEEKPHGLAEVFAAAAHDTLGVNADYSIASLAEIDSRLDWIGGNLASEQALVAGLGAYLGETLKTSGSAAWSLTSWPPALDSPDTDPTSTDGFVYSTHNPFTAAFESLRSRVALETEALDVLKNSPRPIHLVDDPHAEAIARIVAGLAADPTAMEQFELSVSRQGYRLREKAGTSHAEDPLVLRILEDQELRGLIERRWLLAATLAWRRPASANAFGVLGRTLAEDGWPGPGLAAYLRAAEMDPTSAEYAVGAGLAAFDFGEYDVAEEWLLHARELDHEKEWKETIEEALRALGAEAP